MRVTERKLWVLWCAFVVVVAAAAFLVPALRATGGVWPAPLDDTYIYFGCARSMALGAGWSWYPGNGYTSGCTSTIYPLVLAPFWAIGLRGVNLGIGASVVALACLFDIARSLRRIGAEHPSSWLFPPLVVAIPLLSWSWLSGLETALLGACVARAAWAAHRTLKAPVSAREVGQWRTGVWLALAVLTRPELVGFAVVVALFLAHRGGSLAAIRSLLRSAGPPLLVLGLQACVNRALTGEWAPAGGVRKALWSSPYRDDPTIALRWLENLLVLSDQALWRGLGGTTWALALPALVAVAALSRRHRELAIALAAGGLGSLLVVCLNETARYQNLRYAAPTLALWLMAAALGIDTLAKSRAWPLAAALGAVAVLAPARQLRGQVEHFAQASTNIVEQQIEVAHRLTLMMPPPRRVLVNDAGAIPYLAELPPLDGLGLGGFRGMPFARASVHGQPAVVELIERLALADRPDVMALYPGWWGDVVPRFGRPIDAVHIDHNVICGADEKVIYRADWLLLAPPGETEPGAVDTIDVADLVSEREHALEFPHPQGGWVVGDARVDAHGRTRYDAGRVVPPGAVLSFRIASDVRVAPARVRLRTQRATSVELRVLRDGLPRATALLVEPVAGDGWSHLEGAVDDVGGGDRIELTSASGFEIFHAWVLRP